MRLHRRGRLGNFSQSENGGALTATIMVRWGALRLKTVALAHASAKAAHVTLAAEPVATQFRREGQRVLLTLKNPVEVNAGQALKITLS